MLLIVAHSKRARQALRNACEAHADAVRRRFGRAVLFRETEFGAFIAQRLREEYAGEVQVERTVPLNEHRDVPDSVSEAAAAYADREEPSVPYAKFAAGTNYPSPSAMQGEEL